MRYKIDAVRLCHFLGLALTPVHLKVVSLGGRPARQIQIIPWSSIQRVLVDGETVTKSKPMEVFFLQMGWDVSEYDGFDEYFWGYGLDGMG